MYDTEQLIGFYDRNPDKFQPFLRNLICPQTITFDEEEVKLDIITSDKKLAPFVSADSVSKAREQRGFGSETLKPPYIKEKDIVKPSKYSKRIAGEAIGGTLSRAERLNRDRLMMTMEHDKRIARREEWMVSRMIQDGTVTCSGDQHPDAVIDYQMAAGNKITLSGAANWSTLYGATPTSDAPLDSLETWSELTNKNVNTILMEKSAWAVFRKFGAVKDQLDINYLTPEQRTGIVRSPSNNQEIEYKGSIGNFNFLVYNGSYDNDSNVKTKFLDAGRVLAFNTDTEGAMLYGAIAEVENLVATPRFFKNWVSQEPSVENLLTQSAPVPMVPNINDFVSVNVFG